MKIQSFKSKLTIVYTIFFLGVLILYGSILYFSLHSTLYEDFDAELKAKTDKLIKEFHEYRDFQKREWIFGTDYVNVIDSRKRPIISSKNLRGKLLNVFIKNAPHPKYKKVVFKVAGFDKRKLRIINVPFVKGDRRYILQIGSSLRPLIAVLQERLSYIIVSIPFVLIAAGLLGYFFISRAMKPIKNITRTAQNITHEDLSTRIEEKLVDDEFRWLVSAFNDMISRLEKSFKHISEFSTHVAHEIKTPISIIRGEAEIALRKERSPEEYIRVINVCLEESKRMLKTIEDLLLLARLDFRPELFKFERTNLHEFMNEIYEQSKILASQKEISVEKNFKEEVYVDVDKIHLRRLFFNLLNNAIKFTPKNGTIKLSVRKEYGNINISVSDTGIGIPEEDLPKIFNRFFHIDRTGQDTEPSNGLGLSIARSIAMIHNGTIHVTSEPQKGSTFTVTLPIL